MNRRAPFIQRALGWIVTRVGPQHLVILAFLMLALLSTASGVATVLRSVSVRPLWFIGAVATLIGWFLAQRALNVWASAGLGTLLGALMVLIRMGRLGTALWQTLVSGTRLIGWGLGYLTRGLVYLSTTLLQRLEIVERATALPASPQAGPFLGALNILLGDSRVLLSRLGMWLAALTRGDPLYDPVAASVTWGLLFWITAAWAGWMIRRKQTPLLGITPMGILLASVLSYTGAGISPLLFFMGFGLVLIALVHQHSRERRWIVFGVDFSEDISTEIIGMAAAIALVLTLTAAVVPALSMVEIIDWVEERVDSWRDWRTRSNPVAESLGVEPQPQIVPQRSIFEEVAVGGLPRRHLIGSGPELSEEIALIVETGELPPMPEDALMEAPSNHYWRSLTYNLYTGRGWATSRTETVSYEAEEMVHDPERVAHRLLNQRVRVVDETQRMLYAAGTLVTVDEPFEVAWRQGTGEDIFGVRAESNAYNVQTLVSTATVEALQSAGIAYPNWVTERYLRLPEEIPERVLTLAQDLTATEPTPYDRAAAIEQYLRTYPYTLDVPQPPVDQDIADYFLFDLQRGYCDYYATSMVVLARAAGIPARMTVGYITGRYDALNAQYIVSEAEAHAWVEVYFPGYGWIKFEPTGGRPELSRPYEEPQRQWEPSQALPSVPKTSPKPPFLIIRYWYLTLLGLLTGVGLALLALAVLDHLWLTLQSPSQLVLRLYSRLRRHGRHLNTPTQSGDTPHEFETALTDQIHVLADRGWLQAWAARTIEKVHQLIELYVRLNYTAEMSEKDTRQQALSLWWRLRWRLWAFRLWRRLRSRWHASALRPALHRIENL